MLRKEPYDLGMDCATLEYISRLVGVCTLVAEDVDGADDCCYDGLTYAKLLGNDREALKALSNEGVVNGTDGKEFDLKNIYNYLGPCKHLSGKPKMAFIQACQGENIAVVPPASVQSDGNPVLTMQTCDFIKLFAAFYEQS
eukprot:Em0084g4a